MSKTKQRREAHARKRREHNQEMYQLGYKFGSGKLIKLSVRELYCTREAYGFFKLGRKHGEVYRSKHPDKLTPKRSWLHRLIYFILRRSPTWVKQAAVRKKENTQATYRL